MEKKCTSKTFHVSKQATGYITIPFSFFPLYSLFYHVKEMREKRKEKGWVSRRRIADLPKVFTKEM